MIEKKHITEQWQGDEPAEASPGAVEALSLGSGRCLSSDEKGDRKPPGGMGVALLSQEQHLQGLSL